MKRKIVYSERYYVDIGAHVFPTEKYRLIGKKLRKDLSVVNKIEFIEPISPEESDILNVHTREYINKLKADRLSPEETARLELPFSKELLKSASLFCGGTISAANAALRDNFSAHIGGGFHHAFPDHGEGFCVLNDVAVAVRKIIKEKKAAKVLIVDCDLHQGNGTAQIFQKDKNVFTFSIHQENNYPFFKPKGDMDIGLADRTKDREYLSKLEEHIPKILSDFKPEFIMYVAGADPYEHDQIGNLGLTIGGLRKRDEFIYLQAKNYQIPVAVVLAGGYAVKREDTVEIQFNTIKAGIEVFSG